jgi:hypothetical protein
MELHCFRAERLAIPLPKNEKLLYHSVKLRYFFGYSHAKAAKPLSIAAKRLVYFGNACAAFTRRKPQSG